MDVRTRTLCQPLRPPAADPDDRFDYRKAHWERSKAADVGLWADRGGSGHVPEADIVDDRLLSM